MVSPNQGVGNSVAQQAFYYERVGKAVSLHLSVCTLVSVQGVDLQDVREQVSPHQGVGNIVSLHPFYLQDGADLFPYTCVCAHWFSYRASSSRMYANMHAHITA